MKLNWANSIKTYLKVLSFVLLTIFFVGPFITSSYAALLFEEDFETGDLGDFNTSGIPPTTTSSLSRTGTYAMESWIEPGEKRSEVTGGWAYVGEEYWYGFSIFLPEDFIVNYNYEILAQWHGYPDFDMGEDWRNPVMALYSSEGRWSLGMRWDSKRNTFESGKRVYEGTGYFDFGSYETGVWTDWVFHVKWSYESDGFLEIWKNGVKILYYEGPNAFNDAAGPYFKMGIYTGGVPCTRIVYHDEFRMADANSTYADVAPGGNVSWVNIPPTADAGSDIIVDEGEEVLLDGLGSSDPDDGIVDYFWEQTGGPEVDILDPTDVQTSFIAPDLTSSESVSLTFELTVQDSGGLIASDTCVVLVASQPSVPGTATLLTPSGTIDETAPAFTWNAVEGATWYQLYVEDHSSGTVVIDQWYDADTITSGDTCSVTPDLYLQDGDYFWKIRALNDNGYGDWSAALQFSVASQPSVPGTATLLTPSGTIDETAPAFTWNAVEGATWYRLYVQEGSSGSVHDQWYTSDSVTSGSTCSVTPTTTLNSGGHTWWVQTYNSYEYGAWSAALQFSVASQPSVPGTATLLSPYRRIRDKTPTYTWNTVEGATWYQLYVKGRSGKVIDQWYDAGTITSGDTCSVTPDVTLARGSYRRGSYSWKIRAWNDNGYGDWSNKLRFKVTR